jgi:hypothetical protein
MNLPLADTDAAAVPAVELQASRHDTYRLGRVFHLVGRRRNRPVTRIGSLTVRRPNRQDAGERQIRASVSALRAATERSARR